MIDRNPPHASPSQRQAIRALVDEVGHLEVLAILGQIIANDHPDLHSGTSHRSTLARMVAQLKDELWLQSVADRLT